MVYSADSSLVRIIFDGEDAEGQGHACQSSARPAL